MVRKIYPGKEWLDTNGVRIEAHGGSVLYENGVYYWYGEDKSHTTKKRGIWTWGVKMYSSTDLLNWKDEGHIIKPEPNDKKSLFHPKRYLDRPHIIKNPRTGKYVLWLKYSDKCFYAVLTSDSILGPYTLVESCLRPGGHKCGDFDLAVDTKTGDGYIYYEANHDSVYVAKLNEKYTDITGKEKAIYSGLKPPFAREGITHFEHGGKHYILSSGMTGYVPNPCEVAVSNDWMGSFTVLGDPYVDDTSCASFNSQPSDAFVVEGSGQIIIAADRWVPEFVVTKERYESLVRAIYRNYDKSVKASFKDMIDMFRSPLLSSADTSKANYVWLPVEWDGDRPRISWHDEWTAFNEER